MTRPTVAPLKTLSLCSGYGGLDLAVEEVFGAETVAVAEIDPDAARVLRHRWPNVPNLGDITATDWTAPAWQDSHADIITAGFPCQPFSVAGLRQGQDDERHIWPDVIRIVRLVRPGIVVLENVSGLLTRGFDEVLGDLAEAGFDAEWCVLRSSDVGAPHRRARLFVLAADPRRFEPERWRRPDAVACAQGVACVEGGGGDEGRRSAEHRCPVVDWGDYSDAITRWERIVGRPAPSPVKPDSERQLSAEFVEWMMGLAVGWVTDVASPRAAMRLLGNGVVPQQAAAGLRALLN